ncbi:DUF4855 domain-containing protein [Ferdinandcohnia quinoae]|uniref:DUF4855 domain-containing protein n=1 Tax=Fredinandcohnia quinoae TaxID=2918902 RepID=A0AAW5DYD3_9BACI|nr:DUF4855 domain-containing protein [Fredinandcohnia sp. SECRCQ15]MCH1625093.1 DUF4855 domain-containing protein [Fredinandcohnia sp. SECRCQ15]
MKRFIVYITAIILLFMIIGTPQQANATSEFSDVSENHWAYKQIMFLTDQGVINGFADGKFRPTETITRKQAAIMMSYALGLDLENRTEIKFADLKPNEIGYKEVVAAVEEGLLSGTTYFYPNEPLTREEMAKCLVIAYELNSADQYKFSDVPVSSPFYTYISKLAASKITTGYSDGTFRPKEAVNRAQFSMFLARVYNEPHQFEIMESGNKVTQFSSRDEAIEYAVSNPGTSIRPASNHLISYPNSFISPEESNIKAGALIYNGYEIDAKYGSTDRFTPEFFKPYVAFEKDGSYVDTMFDTFIILGRKYPDGEFPETKQNMANYKDWKWYIDRTFSENGAISNLNKAVAQVQNVDKVKVYVAIPYPKDEGVIEDLNGNGFVADSFNRFQMIKWYISEVNNEFQNKKFEHIQFEGFYWLNETVISKEDEQLVNSTAYAVQNTGKKFIYSPHSRSTNLEKWDSYGLDGAYLQMNAHKAIHNEFETKRLLHKGYLNALINGTGINIEIEDSTLDIELVFQNLRNYLEVGRLYGAEDKSIIMYQGTEMVHRLATSPREDYKKMYEDLYKFLRGK